MYMYVISSITDTNFLMMQTNILLCFMVSYSFGEKVERVRYSPILILIMFADPKV